MEISKSAFSIFMDIFPDYQTFATWYKSIPLSDNAQDCPNEKTFTLIAYEYNDSHCAFSEESFKNRFANILYTFYKEFEETTKEIISLMNIPDTSVALDDSTTTNMANIPETEQSTNTEILDFISQQQRTINRKGELRVRREQLSNKRTFTTKTFLNRFRGLFIRIISPHFLQLINEEDRF